MFGQDSFDPWRSTIMVHLSHLSKAQATGLILQRDFILTT